MTRTRSTTSSLSSATTMIGNPMPNVCTDRQRSKSIIRSGWSGPYERRPRIRSRRFDGIVMIIARPDLEWTQVDVRIAAG